MRKIFCGVGGFALYAVLLSSFIVGSLGGAKEDCQPRNESYNIADTKQCDMYHECGKNSNGKTLERLCDDGFVFSEEIRACDYPHNVDCTGRELLQEPKSDNPDCARMNGFYPFPPEDSCQKFYHCLEGKAYEKTCPDGVIFDPSKGTCIHPDLSHRKDCAAKSVLNYTCPNYGKKFVRLRFGDHDRLPHPTNCRKFFICLSDGKPRVGGCPLGKVFNPKLGVCDSPKRVPQCKDYYGKKDLKKLEKLAELGEEGTLAELELEGDSADDDDDNETESEEEHQSAKTSQTPQVRKQVKVQKFQVRRQAGSSPANGAAETNPAADQSTSAGSSPSEQDANAQSPDSQSKATSEDEDDSEEDDD